MPRIEYEPWSPRGEATALVAVANDICAEYQSQGYQLTLRQLYYQFVARGYIENSDKSYKRLGQVINKGRMAGLIDWDFLEDRTRSLGSNGHWTNPGSILSAVAAQYRIDTWSDQPTRVEVWVEKEALAGVIEPVCRQLDIPWFSCRGYVSQSEMWSAGNRITGYYNDGQATVILHLGDHDPSGIDMTRDIRERLTLFMATNHRGYVLEDYGSGNLLSDEDRQYEAEGVLAEMHVDLNNRRHEAGGEEDELMYGDGDHEAVLEVRRIALTMDQIRQYSPPPNPAKLTDSRGYDYVRQYGNESWELDALSPTVLGDLIRDNVYDILDVDKQNALQERQDEQKALLRTLSDRWEDLQAQFGNDAAE